MFLITGATGNVGSALVRMLHGDGHDVRALVRSADRATHLPGGVDIAVGDLDTPETVARAVDGIEAVFHMQTDHGTEQTASMARAMDAARVRRIVVLSSVGAVLDPPPIMGTCFQARERLLDAADLQTTYLRPNTLMPNALAWASSIATDGVVHDPVGPGRVSTVDTDDVAAVAAAALLDARHVDQGYTLTGPEALTTREQVAILADALGREIGCVEETPEQAKRAMVAGGAPEAAAEAMRDLNAMFRTGRCAFVDDSVERICGRPATTFAAWCARNANRFDSAIRAVA